MVKGTVDERERENKLIFMDTVIILGFGEDKRKSKLIGLSLGVEDGRRTTQRSTINKTEQVAAVKGMNNLSKQRPIIIMLQTNGDNMMNTR